MKKNLIEKFGEKIRLDKAEKIKSSERYWKLPATERMHYDSKVEEIEGRNLPGLFLTVIGLKLSVIVPLFVLFAGFMIDKIDILFGSAQTVFLNLIGLIPFFFILDMVLIIVNILISIRNKERLDRRFKLIK